MACRREWDHLGGRPNGNRCKDDSVCLGAAVAKVDLPGGNYAMDHSATLYLLDDGGRLRAVFTPPLDTKTLAADLDAAVAASRG